MEPGSLRQITLTLLVSIMALASGMSTGWLTSMTSKLLSFDSPVGRTTKKDLSQLTVLPLYVGFFVSFIYGFIAKKFGRKDALICVGIPSIVSGFILTFARSKVLLYVGRGFAGCTMVGGAIASFMYISETVSDSVRGTLMATLVFQMKAGILLSYVLGDNLSYEAFNFIAIAISVIPTILILWLPESPHFLVNNGRIKDAMSTLLWLKGGDIKAAKSKLESIKPDRTVEQNISFFQILKYTGSRAALVVSLLAGILQATSGVYVGLNYAEITFKDASSPVNSGNSTIVIAILILVSTLLGVFLIDTAGRKTLLYISFVGGCVSLAAISSFLYLKKGRNVENCEWIPITSVTTFLICNTVGLAMVPGVLANELPAPNVKPAVCSVISATVSAIAIAIQQSLPIFEDNGYMYLMFAVSSGFNFLGIFYTWFMVPETAGMSLTTIGRELRGERVLTLSAGERL
ncbi:hypothetical protein GE061_009481 [Apolygus lucorum]|uniref:Major facilitator superfamily (MFS) profile domain-containing protein n=1 Tax=Apolygus lucorum TaxID=248454 RepID=A0A8S9Y2C8_APOLU|nr:hypothetical protein GE061_009481 [Apolygus lucorum]